MKIESEALKDFREKGYCVVDDFLPSEDSKFVLDLFKKQTDWLQIDQERSHYSAGGPFAFDCVNMPDDKEFYYQRTKRAESLQVSDIWRSFYEEKFLRCIEDLFHCRTVKDTTYVLKYSVGDFSRIHTDDLRGEVDRVDIGVLYYVCDRWVWDWGGLLLVSQDGDVSNMKAVLPKNNRVILLNHQRRLPHCVTPVVDYAKNDRYCVASFIGCDRKLS